MKVLSLAKYAGMCTVEIQGKFYQLPTVIDLDSSYAHARQSGRYDIFGCNHVEQSTDGLEMRDFVDKDFYKLGRQLARQ